MGPGGYTIGHDQVRLDDMPYMQYSVEGQQA